MLIGLPCVGVIILIFGLGGIYLIYLGFKNQQKARASQGWLLTTGRIVESSVSQHWSHDSEGGSRLSYSAHIRYEYGVSGQTFISSQVAFGPAPSSYRSARAQAEANRYPVGAAVTVYYNPDNPQEAVLEQRASGTATVWIVGIAFLGVTACLACPLVGMLLWSILGKGMQ